MQVNITVLSLSYTGPNVEYCKYGGISGYDVTGHFQPQKIHWNFFTSRKSFITEVFQLCDDIPHSTSIVSQESHIFFVVY